MKTEMEDSKLSSDFFQSLRAKEWWWVIRSLQSRDSRAQTQLSFFDQIAHAIENSSEHNKKILQKKQQVIVNHINPTRTGPILSYKLRSSSLEEFLEDETGERNDLESAYAEYTNYVSVFSELRAFDEISKLGLKEVEFLEEAQNQKTPDIKGVDGEGKSVFVEVKCINPPKKEEQQMLARVVDFVEVNENFMDRVNNKISDHLKDAKAKFESVNAYTGQSRRWVYMNIIWGVEAKLQNESRDNLVNKGFIAKLERELNIEVKFFDTFSIN